jgi:ligand-binding SRPBCC domain-containing protein
MPTVRLETRIAASPRACFDLSLSVDAHTASMGDAGERAVAGRTSGQLRLGETVTWRAVHFGVPFRMTASVTAYDAPHRFVDEQVSGPFRFWRHEHRFHEQPDGGTLMTDLIEFASPLGPLGAAVDRLVLGRYMEQLIVTRNTWLRAALEA